MNREKTVSAAVCTIGDEILIGQITDTNSAAISRELGAAGVRVTSMAVSYTHLTLPTKA